MNDGSRIVRILSTLLLLVPSAGTAAAPEEGQEDAAVPSARELEALDLEELLSRKLTVATRTAQTSRDAPGIVSVITRAELAATGARDLLEVLEYVPGFASAMDTEGAVSLGVRGIWGQEGKVLLLLDGQEVNEIFYAGLQLGNRFPLHQVERIEIIRGPGSVMYGGYAELAVVNVITRSAPAMNGVSLEGRYGQMAGTYSARTLSAQLGQAAADGDLAFTASLFAGEGQRSNQTYRPLAGEPVSLAGQSALDPSLVNVGASWRGLKLRFIHDGFESSTRDGYYETIPEVRMGWESTHLDLSWELQPADRVTVKPYVRYKRQAPWRVTDPMSALYYDKTGTRTVAGVQGQWTASPWLQLTGGAEGARDAAWISGEIGRSSTMPPFTGGRSAVDYWNVAAFGEGQLATPIAAFTAGARYEHNSAYGSSFVPRLAATKVLGAWHLKALYSHAFRAPAIENVNAGPGIRPERTRVLEGEAGVRIGKHLFVTANLFDITIADPIVYDVDVNTGIEAYRNYSQTGTRGGEAQLTFRHPRINADLAYSFYSASGKNEIALYAVPGQSAPMLGFAQHKVTASVRLSLTSRLSLAPRVIWLGERWGYLSADAAGNPVAGRLAPSARVGLYLRYRGLLTEGLEVGLSLNNLLDARQDYVQPYAVGHAPLPGPGREAMLIVSYELADLESLRAR